MSEPTPTTSQNFAQQAAQPSPGIVREFLQYLNENKKWWLLPILVAMGLLVCLVTLGTSAVAPLIYPLF